MLERAAVPSTAADTASPNRSRRAAPLPPGDRRAAIVAAAIPLLRRRGVAVTTREVAEAAGVAEGTIFNVFADKQALIAAAVEAALDPGPTIARLGSIDGALGFEERLVEAVRILQVRLAEVWQLLLAVGPDGRPPATDESRSDAAARHVAALEGLLAPRSRRLRRTPTQAAQALFALTVGCSHPGVLDHPMPPEQIVDLFLRGVGGGRR